MRIQLLCASLAIVLGGCGSAPLDSRRGCDGLTGTYLAHAQELSGTCGPLLDGTGPISSFDDACTGVITAPSTTGMVTWTTEATYVADGASGEAAVTLARTGINPCSSDYAVAFTRL